MNTTCAPLLACYDYGQGSIWLLIDAHTEEAARTAYPYLTYFTPHPPWMGAEEAASLRRDLDAKNFRWSIDAEPTGWLLSAAEEQPSPALPPAIASALEPVIGILERAGYKVVQAHDSPSFNNFFVTFSKQGCGLTVARDRGQLIVSGPSRAELDAHGLWRAFSGPAPIASALQAWLGSGDA